VLSKCNDIWNNADETTQNGIDIINTIDKITDFIESLPAADVQPLSVVAEHIKKRLYQTAFNTTEEKARDTIVDMAKRIDIWIDELGLRN
jgi:hypothetical protein